MNEVYREGRKEWGDRLDRTGYLKSKGYSDFEINSNLLPIYPDVDQRVGYDLEALVELVTYGLTDIKTQEFMETIPYSPQGKKTVWNEFVETIRKILGVPAKQDTVLSEILRAGEDVLSVGPVAINNALNEYRSERGRTYLQQGNRFATEANTSENIKLREAVDRAEEIVKQTPRGEIPIYNINASDAASQEEIENRLMQVLDHEMIHAFRAKDLITESEYQYLKKQVKRAKVPKSYDAQFEGQTFYDRAIALNSLMVTPIPGARIAAGVLKLGQGAFRGLQAGKAAYQARKAKILMDKKQLLFGTMEQLDKKNLFILKKMIRY